MLWAVGPARAPVLSSLSVGPILYMYRMEAVGCRTSRASSRHRTQDLQDLQHLGHQDPRPSRPPRDPSTSKTPGPPGLPGTPAAASTPKCALIKHLMGYCKRARARVTAVSPPGPGPRDPLDPQERVPTLYIGSWVPSPQRQRRASRRTPRPARPHTNRRKRRNERNGDGMEYLILLHTPVYRVKGISP